MSTTLTPATAPAGVAIVQLTQGVLRRMARLQEIGEEMLQLLESDRRNFLASGTIAGQGVTTAAPTLILKPNYKRRGLSIQNTGSSGALTVGLGVMNPQPGAGLVLSPGASWDGRISGELWLGLVSVIGSQTGVQYSWLEASGPER
jgi:hypothetical protein